MQFIKYSIIFLSALVSGCFSSSFLSESLKNEDTSEALGSVSIVELVFDQEYFTESKQVNVLKLRTQRPAIKDIEVLLSYSGDFSQNDFDVLPNKAVILSGQSEGVFEINVKDDTIPEYYKKIKIDLKLVSKETPIDLASESYNFDLRDNDAVSVNLNQYTNEVTKENDSANPISISLQIYGGGTRGGGGPSLPTPIGGDDETPGKDPTAPLGFDLKLKLVKITGNLSQADIVEKIDEIILPGNSNTATLKFHAKADGLAEGWETAILEYKIVNAATGSSGGMNEGGPKDGGTASGRPDLTIQLKVLDADKTTIYMRRVADYCPAAIEHELSSCSVSLERSGDIGQPLNVNIDYSTGTATVGVDFTSPNIVQFAAGQAKTTFDMLIVDDWKLESMESVIAKIAEGQDFSCNCEESVLYNITDDDSSPENRSVEVKAFVNLAASNILLDWSADLNYTTYKVFRREFGSNVWGPVRAQIPIGQVTYLDEQIESGKIYEYKLERMFGTGFVTAAVNTPARHFNGRVLVIAEAQAAAALSVEISAWLEQIAGEGWDVLFETASATDTVVSVKDKILNRYSESGGLKSVILFGDIPVPYSGSMAPDGHADHSGAWPADVYYGDVNNDLWTDTTINNVAGSRPQNRNSPGDGKYDTSTIPSEVEISVGRIDLSDMPAFAPATEIDLLRRYLQKMSSYRTAQFTPNRRMLIDDNFGDFYSESFASTAWMWAGSIVGREQIYSKDYLTELSTQNYLWAYGCGGGYYNSAAGIGTTQDIAAQSINAVFNSLFGSYFGDWDSTNNFLRAPLAAEGLALTNVWSGRPKWFFHPMASNESMSSIILQNWNNRSNSPYPDTPGVHVAFMGDPTLKDYVFAGVQNLVTSVDRTQVTISWQDSQPDIEGYFVYASADKYSGYRLVNQAPVLAKSTVVSLQSNERFIMVRSVKSQNTFGGIFKNLSAGVIKSL